MVTQPAGRASSASAATGSQVSSGDEAAPTADNNVSATDGDATLQTAIAAASSAAAGGVGVSNGTVAAESASQAADESAASAAGIATPPAPRFGRLPLAQAADSPSGAATTTPKAAAGVLGAAVLAAGAPDKHVHTGNDDSPAATDLNGVAGAAPAGINTAAATDAAPTPTLKVAAGVDTPEFGQGLADRVSWMVGNNLNGAKLQVNPSQLGPIEVRIAVQAGHAQVWLTSHSAVTRDALESSSQKLREMLGAQGFGQVSVDISQRSFQERSPQAQPYEWTPSADLGGSPASVTQATARPVHLSNSAVDAYA
jgi:flagellar hook-length control protein FliK